MAIITTSIINFIQFHIRINDQEEKRKFEIIYKNYIR